MMPEITETNEIEEVVETAEPTAFSESDTRLIVAMGLNVEVALHPMESCPDVDVGWYWLEKFLEKHKQAEDITLKLRHTIGKFLLWAKGEPEFYHRKGYANYTTFIREFVVQKMGFGRSSLYQSRLWNESMPNMEMGLLEELGSTKATILATYTKETNSDFPEYVEAAKSRSAVDFEKWVVERGAAHSGDLHTATILIRTTEAIADQWNSFRNDARISERVGADRDDKKLEAMLQECSYWLGDPQRQTPCEHCSGTGRVHEE